MIQPLIKQNMASRSRKTRYKHSTIGFGVPTTTAPHHFKVHVPVKNGNVVITENLGIEANRHVVEIERGSVVRANWAIIKREIQTSFNSSLRRHNLQPSSWKTGDNLVDRLLGKELCVLAWAIERCSNESVHRALRNWHGLRPEDRWWLFGMAVRTTEAELQRGSGWRIALGYALAATDEPSINKRLDTYSP